jgi:hypothetical protein
MYLVGFEERHNGNMMTLLSEYFSTSEKLPLDTVLLLTPAK